MKDDLIDLEDIELTGTKAVNGLPDMLDKCSQLSLVILRNRLACGPPLRLAGHTSEATNFGSGRTLSRRPCPHSGSSGRYAAIRSAAGACVCERTLSGMVGRA